MRRPHRFVFLAALMIAPAALRLVSDAVGPVGTRGPAITFPTTEFDFGRVAHGRIVERAFRFENTGDQRLEITRVQTSCGCTAGTPSKRSLSPGEAATLLVRFDTRRKPASRPEQAYTHHILVSTNAKENADVRLVLTGVVVSRFDFVPMGGLVFRKVHVLGYDEETSASVEIYPRTPGSLRAAEVTGHPAGLRIRPLEPCTRDGRDGIRLTVALADELEVGPVRGSIRVRTTDPEQPALEVPIYATVIAPFRASPPAVYLTTGAAPRVLRIIPSRRDLPAVKVLGFGVEEDGGGPPSVEIRQIDAPSGRALLTLSLRPKAPTLVGQGSVVVRLQSERTPIAVVPYRVLDRKTRAARVAKARGAQVIVSPPELELRRYTVGAPQPTHITVTSLGAPLRTTDLRLVGSDQLEVRQEPLSGNRAVRLLVTVQAKRPGTIYATLYFRPRPGGPQLAVPIHGSILPALKAVPGGVCLIAGRPSATVRVRRQDGEAIPASVHAVAHATPPGVVASVRRADGDLVIDLRCAALHAGAVEGFLTVETDLPGEPPLRLPIFGVR